MNISIESRFFIFTCTAAIFGITASFAAETTDLPSMPGMKFETRSDLPGKSVARLSWDSNCGTMGIDAQIWRPDRIYWGTRYLVDAFNLKEFSPSSNNVVVFVGLRLDDVTEFQWEALHYIYHPNKQKVCIVHFRNWWYCKRTTPTHPSYNGTSWIDATLIGCHSLDDQSRP